MIKRIKLFINDNEKSKNIAEIISNKLVSKGFIIDNDNFDLGIAIGGDGSFLRMVKNTNFDSDVKYVGINAGTLGFLQEIKLDNMDEFINELKNNKYKIEEIGIQETNIYHKDGLSKFYSLNEIVIRDKDLKVVKLDIKIDGDLLERYIGDGILVATSSGSTAYNLSSVIIPNNTKIKLIPSNGEQDLIVTIDGENNVYKNVHNIETKLDDKKIKCLRLSYYNFPEKINEKLLTD